MNSIARKFILLLRNNESIKEKKKLSYHAENAWEIYGVCNENYTTTRQLFSFINEGVRSTMYSHTHTQGSKYLSIDNSFFSFFSSFYRHVFCSSNFRILLDEGKVLWGSYSSRSTVWLTGGENRKKSQFVLSIEVRDFVFSTYKFYTHNMNPFHWKPLFCLLKQCIVFLAN